MRKINGKHELRNIEREVYAKSNRRMIIVKFCLSFSLFLVHWHSIDSVTSSSEYVFTHVGDTQQMRKIGLTI